MRELIHYIRRHLFLRLGLKIMFTVIVVFTIFLGYIFYHTRHYAQHQAILHANKMLDSTVVRIESIMDWAEGITAEAEPEIMKRLNPDSLLAFTRHFIEQQPNVMGFTIAMEPDYFPEMGKRFSAYTLRQADGSLITVDEDNYDYFEKYWYKIPREKEEPCWLEPYIDEGEGVLTSSQYNYSYCKPLRNHEGKIIGIICTDLWLRGMSQAVTAFKPYPNSSAIMLSHDGKYIIHPDTTKLARHTIFSDPDPEAQEDVIQLGEKMLAGHTGMQRLRVDHQQAFVFFRPLERTGWSIAIVCPASDVYHDFYHMLYSVWTIICIALLLMLVLCYHSIRHSIIPLRQLAWEAKQMAKGDFDQTLAPTRRRDSVGQLQNGFIQMQQALHTHVSEIQQVNAALEQQNQELVEASKIQQEADNRKTAFVQDMLHQIRTPLNIINGFTQVLAAEYHNIPEEDMSDILQRMKSSAKVISHITSMLLYSSTDGSKRIIEHATFSCNALFKEAIDAIVPEHPNTVTIAIETEVADDFTIHTNREALLKVLGELLDNSNKFTKEGHITIGCRQKDDENMEITVSDTGLGIPLDKRDRIFSQFTKLDVFSEGIGLGLSICQNTIHMLGGEIVLDENNSCGTRFIITLPIHHN